MRKKPAIPDVPAINDAARVRFDSAVKEVIEVIIGRRGGTKIAPINTTNLTGTEKMLADKINEILELLQ